MPYKSLSLAAIPYDPVPDQMVDLKKEYTRQAFASSIRTLSGYKETEVLIDNVADMCSVSEGSHLAAYNFDMYKSEKSQKPPMNLELLDPECKSFSEWSEGFVLADCQNFSKTLMEIPSNFLTPEKFVTEVVNVFEQYRGESEINLEVVIRDEAWLREQKMNALLAVAQGSQQKPYMIELHLSHPKADNTIQPLVMAGKGVCFDSGGISIKPSANMGLMRGDMGGAACVAATALGAMRLNVPGRIVCLMGLVENMPSGSSYKPGDVIISRSGLSIEVDNTDAEGRLVLADILDYSQVFQPSAVLDVATLTGAIGVALGGAYTGTYSTTNKLFETLKKAGAVTGDQVWRMPLSSYYTDMVKDSLLADVTNSTKKKGAGSCTAAAFLSQFVKCDHWMHLDIAGVMENKNDVKYLPPGMSGRPTRTLIHFCKQYFPTK